MSRKHRPRHRHKRRSPSPREVLCLFLRQNNISARNIEHIRELTQHPDAEVKALAEVVLQIARVKPGRRRRMQVIAREHPDLFVDVVAVLGEEFWEDLFYRCGGRCGWLWGQWEVVRSHLRFQEHGKTPCWCGSGRAYWHCCAERDEALGEQLAAEEQEREWALNPESIPWWHPDSGIDHYTRSAYEMYYIDSDHPFALTPPEWREKPQEAFTGKRRTKRNY